MEARLSIEENYGLLREKSGFSAQSRSTRLISWPHWKTSAIAGLTMSNLMLIGAILSLPVNRISRSSELASSLAAQIAIVPRLPKKAVEFQWYTPYSSQNLTAANELWDQISSAHGLIAVDHGFAADQQWIESMPVPGDEGKGLYLLESYHQLHCLKIVRQMLLDSVDNVTLSYPVMHAMHCFDYFRQYVMCHADNTPLYTIGDHTSGNGQIHMCNDWAALRDYATENSACFKDREGEETLREQFGHCDGGIDGLEAAYSPLQ